MAGEITWLKKKYRAAKSSKSVAKKGSGNSGNRGRSKINQQAKDKLKPQPKMIMVVDGLTGKARMQRLD